MKQQYFIVVVAHSLHGRLRRIHIPHQVVYAVIVLAIFGCFSAFGLLSSYLRMTWKVSNYNSLRQEADSLRARYHDLEKVVSQTKAEMATLQLFASEVSLAYGIKRKLEGPTEITAEGRLVPSFSETVEEYNLLKSANFSRFYRRYPRMWQTNIRPSIWPLAGRLLGHFGKRNDPFSGEWAYHTGVDISGPTGATVRATADGIVVHAEYSAGYGRLVIVDHGNGVQTYYAHLSRFDVIAGQEIRRGESVGGLGASGRVTAPHLHYEVRVGGNPVNPYNYLSKSLVARSAKPDLPF